LKIGIFYAALAKKLEISFSGEKYSIMPKRGGDEKAPVRTA